MSKLGLAMRSGSTLLRALEFAISALVLGIFSYYLAFLTKHHMNIPTWQKAVEGMSGASVIYTGFAVLLTFFLGGITIFAFLAVLLDICFCGCFVAIAVLVRAGAKSCGSVNDSPIGAGQHASCQLQRAVFAVAIAAAVLFLISAFLQVALSRNHKKEKRYGPGPANNYTSGSGKRKPWQRKNKRTGLGDAELGAVGAAPVIAAEEKHHGDGDHHNGNIRPSDDTAMTGTTAPVADGYGGPVSKYGNEAPPSRVTGNRLSRTTDSTVYAPQTSGATGTVPEMEAGQPGSVQNPYVQHDPNPYAEVHHGGYVHQAQTSEGYVR